MKDKVIKMPKERDLKLDEYDISWRRYRELKYFCMQYNEKKEKIKSIVGLSAVNYSGTPGAKGVFHSQTETQAIKIAGLRNDIKLIDDTAMEADSTIYKQLLENITDGVPYEYLQVPCGRRQFYRARRKFFYLLSQKR